MSRALPITALFTLLFVDCPARLDAADPPKELSPKERSDKFMKAVTLSDQHARLANEGRYARALPLAEQALALRREILPDGHLLVARSLSDLGLLLQEMGEYEKSFSYLDQALGMYRNLFPTAKHPDGNLFLAAALNNLGTLNRNIGALDKALPYYEQAQAMLRKLYPDGHPYLAANLNNLGELLNHLGEAKKAAPFYEEALAMRRKLYPETGFPNGHADLAQSLMNMGAVRRELGATDKAIVYYEKALAMERKLFPKAKFPDGHPLIASTLHAMAIPILDNRDYARARALLEESLEMRRRLYPEKHYPNGHPELIDSLFRLGDLLQWLEEYDKSIALCRESLDLGRKLFDHQVATAPLGDALSLFRSLPDAADAFLTAAVHVSSTDAAAYRAVWDTKAKFSRALERRLASIRVAGAGQEAKLFQLRDNRRLTEQELQSRHLKTDDRDRRLAELADERDRLEREIAAAVPLLRRWKERDALGPEDLTKTLPAGSALIDFMAYTRCDGRPERGDEQLYRRRVWYSAFVLLPGQAPRRVELGEAVAIDAAVMAWRRAIAGGNDGDAGQRVRGLIWAPIARLLPKDIGILYISTDGELARVPWSALPGAKTGAILLEEFTGGIAVIPHGPFLLEQLKFPHRQDGPDRLLAIGDLDYGGSRWLSLPGTTRELNALSFAQPLLLRKTEGTSKRLAEELAKVRYAHLATHGFFSERELVDERIRALKQLIGYEFRTDRSAPRLTWSNPLAYAGLVLANGEILTGMAIVELALDYLQLVTLSACETGLGRYQGGRGVESLQSAFHLAGCPNVIASLWKVNDAATAALMAKFYHELWVNKKPPIEALREAQLTIYRHPARIPALAGERGKPDFAKTVELNPELDASAKRKQVTPTRLWAAFVLSGVGK